MKISREDVLRVAQLAHLELAPEEVETYRGQLDKILAYIDKLQQLDISGVEPMSQMRPQTADGPQHSQMAVSGDGAPAAGAEPELRDDLVVLCNVAEAVLAEAPDAAKPFFRVPKVIER